MMRLVPNLTVMAAMIALAAPQAASAAGDPAAGAKLFVQCRVCHTVAPADRNGLGPNLFGVVGSKAAARKGFVYSPALTKSGLVWTPAKLDAFLKKPSALVPGTRMAFAGVSADQNRQDLIAYLATLKGKR